MKETILILICFVIMASSTMAGIQRIDISPMGLVNLSAGASENRIIGGAVAADLFVSDHFAIRTSVGYVKNRYNSSISKLDLYFGDVDPAELDEPNHSFRLSVAPYAEAHVGSVLRPYITLTGSVGSSSGARQVLDIRDVRQGAFYSSDRLLLDSPASTYFDLSASVGLKVPLTQNISFFSELQHQFYSHYYTGTRYDSETMYQMVPYGFDQYPTFISVGLTYNIHLSR